MKTRDPIHGCDTAQLGAAQASGETTSVELVEAAWARMDAYDREAPALNAILTRAPGAPAWADRLDAERANGAVRGPLHGVPIVIKDNISFAGLPLTAGSAALASLIPQWDAAVVERLRAAGAVVVAKTNLHELAAGLTTVGSAGGQTRNPFDPTRTPGGSSGGTAAALAASYCPLGLGTDTCGSIRIPAAHCALFGLRPTQGLSPMRGIVPLSTSQDVVAPLARSAYGLAAALDVVLGEAYRSAAGGDTPTSPFRTAVANTQVDGLRIGVVEELFGSGSRQARSATRVVRAALQALHREGSDVDRVTAPDLRGWLGDTSMIRHEFKFALEAFLSSFPDPPVRSLPDVIESGLFHRSLETRFKVRARPTSADTEDARRALERRAALTRNVLALMDRASVDLLAYPTSRVPATRIGEAPAGANASLSAHTGFPAISIPVGLTSGGLPVGLELLGRPFADSLLVGVAAALERILGPVPRPSTVPHLTGGMRPAVREGAVEAHSDGLSFRATLSFDQTRSLLRLSWSAEGVAPPDCRGLILSRAVRGRQSMVLHTLAGAGRCTGEASAILAPDEVSQLERGHLAIRLLTRERSARALDCPIPAVRGGS